MGKSVRYKDGTKIQEGTEAWELYANPPKVFKVPNAPKDLHLHMEELDKAWRKAEGRKPVSELTEREKMLEGRIPWDPKLLKAETPLERDTLALSPARAKGTPYGDLYKTTPAVDEKE